MWSYVCRILILLLRWLTQACCRIISWVNTNVLSVYIRHPIQNRETVNSWLYQKDGFIGTELTEVEDHVLLHALLLQLYTIISIAWHCPTEMLKIMNLHGQECSWTFSVMSTEEVHWWEGIQGILHPGFATAIFLQELRWSTPCLPVRISNSQWGWRKMAAADSGWSKPWIKRPLELNRMQCWCNCLTSP